MYCPRLEHFVRFDPDGSITRCGHMVNSRSFDSTEDLESSDWLKYLKNEMASDKWPKECVRCQQSETIKGKSVRTASLTRHHLLKSYRNDYLIVGGVLDNICNSACQTCNSNLSTKIGSLEGKYYKKVNNFEKFCKLPQHRITEIDINGGEPTASKNYKSLLKNLPNNVKIVRMNTNASRIIKEIETVLQNNVKVIVTLSLDGVGKVHDYIRWPIKWDLYRRTVDHYVALREKYAFLTLDFWTTVSCFNVSDMQNILDYSAQMKIPHDWAFLSKPSVLNPRFKNMFTKQNKNFHTDIVGTDHDNSDQLQAFIDKQDKLRGISVKDYFNF